MATNKYPSEIIEAAKLHRKGKQQESRDCLRDFLLQQPANIDALLWLARVTPDPQEASAAAELALKLDPGNEVAQRVAISVRKQKGESPGYAAERAELSAAVALSTGMTLAQARVVNWPFREINRPIGEVMDDGTITLRDLGWAVENAWDARIRDAAKTILLSHLIGAEPQEPPPSMRVVVGSRFTEQQERRSVLFLGLLLGLGLALAVLMILVGVAGILQLLPRWVSLATFGALGLVWMIARLSDQYDDRADQYRMGRWGEEKVIDVLRYSLDGRWTLFRNFEWSDRKGGDVDLILAGPGGVWAFEVKAYSSQVRNIGDRWERKGQWWWHKLTNPPGQQARRNAAWLREYLKNNSVDVRWVEPVVVWAGEPDSLTVQDPAIPVWDLEELSDHLEELWQGRFLTEETIQQVVDVLERAAQATKEQKWHRLVEAGA